MENLEVIVLGANSYSFNDRDTGRLVEGVNVWFIETNQESNDMYVGSIPKKATLPIEKFNHIRKNKFPFHSKANISFKMTGRGVQSKIDDFEYVKAAELKF